MSNINVYPFARKIVLEQKTEAEQKELLAEANKDVNPLVVPADYTPVYTTDKPIAGITDVIATQKPAISVVEAAPVKSEPTIQKATPPPSMVHPFAGTFFVTALVVVSGYFLYKSLK